MSDNRLLGTRNMKKIIINSHEIEYQLRRNKRSRRLRLSVYPDSSVVVTLPYRVNETIAENFLREKSAWLLDKILKIRVSGQVVSLKASKADFLKNKKKALDFVIERTAFWNRFYNFKYRKISVKNQKTRWGSCSRKGNLNFNFKLLFLPGHIADYVIVHELCHLQEFNHSSRFWKQVARTVPDYLAIRRELRKGNIR